MIHSTTALSPGTKLGPYEIIAPIGAGGMGEVYRAKDTRLDRTVAIKVLPSHLSADPERKQRFEREARTISSLNHPHICTLHDIGHQDGIDYLVMEYLEGDTLSERLSKGALPTEQVMRYGIQIAEALDKAHRQSIIHRDLKPGNIILTKSGAKLLDFGLAKYQETKAPTPGQSQMETRYDPLTEEGVVLGTVQYMAPEQLEGKQADERTDIFALGEVLYEMVTGQRTFKGTSKAQVMAAILSSEPPPISTVQPLAPPALDHVVKKCLAKDPDDRWQSAHDVGSELRWIAETGSRNAMPAAVFSHPRKRERFLTIALAISILAVLGLAFAFNHFVHRSFPAEPSVLSMSVPGTSPPTAHAISPDGRWVAFSAVKFGAAGSVAQNSIWVRSLDSLTLQELPDTVGATFLFWSPDSRFIGFFAQRKLKKIAVTGGAAQTLCDAPDGRGGSWSKDGVILFAPTFGGALYRVSETGGEVKLVTPHDASGEHEESCRWPYFLPDGRHFLYLIRSARPETAGIYEGSLDSRDKRRLLPDESTIAYASPGYLFFVRDGKNLMAQPFDATRLQLSGEAFPVAVNVSYGPDVAATYADFAVSDNGTLTYSPAAPLKTQLTWFDRAGKEAGLVGQRAAYGEFSLSPDEKQLVVGRKDLPGEKAALWIADLSGGSFARFTFEAVNYYEGPIWSPDGSRVAFNATRGNTQDLYQKASGGTGKEEVLIHSENWKGTDDWSRDGQYFLYQEQETTSKWDLWVLPLGGDRKPVPYLQTQFNEVGATFSPDGKWVAYTSDETGRNEVYVRPFPDAAGGKWQISTDGGSLPRWRQDGKEMFYLTNDGKKMMVADVKMAPTFQPGVASPLFQAGGTIDSYVVTKDGQRFLVTLASAEQTPEPITVILNWTSLLKR
jgi:serine/threonine protein kinase